MINGYRSGAETACRYCDGNVKANFSFFATITADGSKLPLVPTAKGKTDRCHNNSEVMILIFMMFGIRQVDGRQCH
jgi:hypothetical protein